jgi:hypothetical protein
MSNSNHNDSSYIMSALGNPSTKPTIGYPQISPLKPTTEGSGCESYPTIVKDHEWANDMIPPPPVIIIEDSKITPAEAAERVDRAVSDYKSLTQERDERNIANKLINDTNATNSNNPVTNTTSSQQSFFCGSSFSGNSSSNQQLSSRGPFSSFTTLCCGASFPYPSSSHHEPSNQSFGTK